jgi:uncharacterized protein YdeI (YjbR/CyaY-like superfamily)
MTELKTLTFKTPARFRKWLERNHAKSAGLWLRFCKKNSGEISISYAEALDEALCYGWIDGQAKALDEKSHLQRFTPRTTLSGWSKRNTQHAERLIESGAMNPAGLRAIAAAKADGRWQAAYDSPRHAKPPEDFLKALGKNKKAKAFFETLNKTNLYSIVYRLQTAKRPETRERRMKAILEMLERGEKFHP